MSISYLRSPLLKSEVVTGQLVCWKAYKNGFHIIAWHFLNVMTRRRVLLLDIIYLFFQSHQLPVGTTKSLSKNHWSTSGMGGCQFFCFSPPSDFAFFTTDSSVCVCSLFYLILLGVVSFFFLICFVFRPGSYWCLFYEQHQRPWLSSSSITGEYLSLSSQTHFYRCCFKLLVFLEIIKLSRREWEKEKEDRLYTSFYTSVRSRVERRKKKIKRMKNTKKEKKNKAHTSPCS